MRMLVICSFIYASTFIAICYLVIDVGCVFYRKFSTNDLYLCKKKKSFHEHDGKQTELKMSFLHLCIYKVTENGIHQKAI